MSQTSYDMDMQVGINGMIADSSPHKLVTMFNPVDEIPFGRVVAKASGVESGIELPDSSGAVLVGVAHRDMTVEQEAATADDAYPINSDVAVGKRGHYYVLVDSAVTPDSSVFVRHTANGAKDKLGVCRANNDGGNALAFSNAKFLTSAADGGIAILDVNLP